MELIDKKQAAEMLGVSTKTVDALIAAGDLPYYRIGVKLIRLDKRDVTDYITNQRTLVVRGRVRSAKKIDLNPCEYVPGMKVV